MNSKQFRELVGISKATELKMRTNGTSPRFLKVGPRMLRYLKEDVDAWIAQHRTGGTRAAS